MLCCSIGVSLICANKEIYYYYKAHVKNIISKDVGIMLRARNYVTKSCLIKDFILLIYDYDYDYEMNLLRHKYM